MKALLTEEKWINLTPITLVLFIFFLPISPSLKSIFLVISIFLILCIPYYNQHLLYAFNTLWGRAAIGLFAVVLLSTFWSQAPAAMQWIIVGKYLKLLYLPIFAVGFINSRVRFWGLQSYLVAIALTCILCILKSKAVFSPGGDPGEIFYNHIVTGFMVAFGAYLAGLFACQSKGYLRIVYLLLVLLCSYQVLFINMGRTGYIVYFILMALLILQKFSFIKSILGITLFTVLMFFAYNQSIIMHNRVDDLVTSIKSLQETSSLGYRMQFHAYAKTLFAKHPIMGIGTGGFKYKALKDNPVPLWGMILIDPHSQYWLTLAEQGLIGLFFLLLFLVSLLISAFQLKETRPILLGILTVFSIAAFSDTILCYSALGFILIIMSALSFGELIEKRSNDLNLN